MPDSRVCFLVCEGCGPTGLYEQLRNEADELADAGYPIEVRHPTCLSACRFGHVVKVRTAEGGLACYSSEQKNGFTAFHDNPLDELLERHVRAQFRAHAG